MLSKPWPSTQPLRAWSHQCADRDYMDVCTRYRVPGQEFCENHARSLPKVVRGCSLGARDNNVRHADRRRVLALAGMGGRKRDGWRGYGAYRTLGTGVSD